MKHKNKKQNRGILGLKRGAILVSLCWVAILVHIIDRKWWQAAAWCIMSAVFSIFGIIHVPVSAKHVTRETDGETAEHGVEDGGE